MRATLLFAGVVLAACSDTVPTTLLDGPRIVAVIADPPTAAVDGTVSLTLVTALDGAPATPDVVRWRACSPATLVVDPARDCVGDRAEPLSVDVEGRAWLDVGALARRFEIPLPPVSDDPCGRAIVPLMIVVEAELGGARLIASKQVIVGQRPPPRTNPQFLQILADGLAISDSTTFERDQQIQLSADLARDSLDRVCEPADTTPSRRENVRVAVYVGGGAMASDLAFDVLEVADATIAGTIEVAMPGTSGSVPLWLVAVDEGGGVDVVHAVVDVR